MRETLVTLRIIWLIGLTLKGNDKKNMGNILAHILSKPLRPKTTLDLDIGGESVVAVIRWNAKAKRLILRVDPRSGDLAVTLPKRVSLKEAKKFIAERSGWIKDQRTSIVITPPLGCGHVINFKGLSHTLVFTGASPRGVWLEEGSIRVGGPVDHAPARLQRWLKRQAKDALMEAAHNHAGVLGLEFNSLAVADTKSRWGSCSSQKNLRFSWRLILAEPRILNYVAAHEVAHLEEMNHSPAFWALVEVCDSNWKTHRRWLKKEGHTLFAMANL